MFIKPSLIINLQQDLGDFAKLCNEHNFKPSKEELTDIINYLLIVQHYSMNGTMTESVDTLTLNDLNESILNYLYENFENVLIVEKGGDYGSGELGDIATAVSTVLGGGSLGTGGIFLLVSFLFKKGKIKSIIKSIDAINQKELSLYKDLVKLESKKAKLTGKEVTGLKAELPSYK